VWVGDAKRRSLTLGDETQVLPVALAPLAFACAPSLAGRAERASACQCVQSVPRHADRARCSCIRSPWQCMLCLPLWQCCSAAHCSDTCVSKRAASGAERHPPPTSPIVEGLGRGPRGPVPNPQGAWLIEQGQSGVRVWVWVWVGARVLASAHTRTDQNFGDTKERCLAQLLMHLAPSTMHRAGVAGGRRAPAPSEMHACAGVAGAAQLPRPKGGARASLEKEKGWHTVSSVACYIERSTLSRAWHAGSSIAHWLRHGQSQACSCPAGRPFP
jgi:hypothetical protein